MISDPNLDIWLKLSGQPVSVTKSGQIRWSHVRDISQRSECWYVREVLTEEENVQMKYTVAARDCVRKKKKEEETEAISYPAPLCGQGKKVIFTIPTAQPPRIEASTTRFIMKN